MVEVFSVTVTSLTFRGRFSRFSAVFKTGCFCGGFPGGQFPAAARGAVQDSSTTPPAGQPEELHLQQHRRGHRHFLLSVRPERGKDYQVAKYTEHAHHLSTNHVRKNVDF